jgi:hypothetical protein
MFSSISSINYVIHKLPTPPKYNTIINGNFISPSIHVNGSSIFMQYKWNRTGNLNLFYANGVSYINSTAGTSIPGGPQYIACQAVSIGNARIYQQVNFTTGNFLLSLNANPRPSYASCPLNIEVNGFSTGNFNPTVSWSVKTLNFTIATAGIYNVNIYFVSTDSSDKSSAFTNVSIIKL